MTKERDQGGLLPRVIADVENVLAGAEFAANIESLHKRNVGRAIVLGHGPAAEMVGMILPVNKEGSEHAILINDGSIAVIKPESGGNNALRYKFSFSPDKAPLRFFDDTLPEEVMQIIFSAHSAYGALPVLRNNNPADVEQINNKLEEAFSLANAFMAEREAAKNQTIYFSNEAVNRHFGPPPDLIS